MIYMQMMGGLANQVFQAAAALHVAGPDHIDDVICDTSWLEAHRSGGITARDFELGHIGFNGTNTPPALPLEQWEQAPTPYDRTRDYRMQGYFQDLKWWSPWIRDELRRRFQINDSTNQPAISIHVRRGDYVTNPSATAWHGVMDVDYYVRALLLAKADVPDIKYVFIYSDDLDWCNKVLTPELDKATGFAPRCFISDGFDHFGDLRMMAQDHYHIIGNSTFAWLGSYLSNTTRGVIYPKAWLTHNKPAPPIFPATWTQLA